jgi:hypothetical protein
MGDVLDPDLSGPQPEEPGDGVVAARDPFGEGPLGCRQRLAHPVAQLALG